jgi:hypothetical protein
MGCSPTLRAAFDQMQARKIGSKSADQNSAQPQGQQGLDASDADACPVARPSPHLPTPAALPSHTQRSVRTKKLQAAVDALGDLADPNNLLWFVRRMALAFEMVRKLGGMAFTLNLSLKRERSLLDHVDPVDALRRYIGRELRTSFGRVIPFAFIFEVCPKGRLHVHGAILSRPDALDDKERIREALARAGGKIKGKGASRQVKLEPQTDGIGWLAYLVKKFDTTCDFLGTHKITFVSDELTALLRDDQSILT